MALLRRPFILGGGHLLDAGPADPLGAQAEVQLPRDWAWARWFTMALARLHCIPVRARRGDGQPP
jgi:hypothetical protein